MEPVVQGVLLPTIAVSIDAAACSRTDPRHAPEPRPRRARARADAAGGAASRSLDPSIFYS